MRTNTKQIGTLTLYDATVFDVPQEYAGASMQVKVLAGTYPIFETQYRGYSTKKYVCDFGEAEIVSDYFLNRIGAYTSPSVNQHVGTTLNHSIQRECYDWARYAAEGFQMGPDSKCYGSVELLPDYTWSCREKVSQYAKSVLCKEYQVVDGKERHDLPLVEVWKTWEKRSYKSYRLEAA